jgi:hypothetical protein
MIQVMKRLGFVFLLAALAVSLHSCKSKNVYSSPEKVSQAFVTAFQTADFDNMYKYTVKSNAVVITNLQKFMKQHPDKLEQMHGLEVKIEEPVGCTYENDSLAVCECNFTRNGQKNKMVLRVKKKEDKWLVDMSDE